MTLSIIAKQLGWYEPELILNPPGAGAKNCIDLVREKIGKEIERKLKQSIEIGILVRDPKSNLTQSPLAIICNFFTEPSNEIIFLAHKLAWNFCRSPLLIIITPEWFNVLSCYKMPSSNQEDADKFSRKKSLFELNEAHNHPAKIIQFPVDKISPVLQSLNISCILRVNFAFLTISTYHIQLLAPTPK